jgi:TP901 family phage tail tape measure protein
MSALGGLGSMAAVHIVIKAVDRASKVIYNIIREFMTLEGIVASAGVLLGGYLAYKGTQAWISYEDALVRVSKTTNATTEQMQALDYAIRDMAVGSRIGQMELVNIMAIAGQLGFRGKELITFTDLVVRSMIAWEMPAEEAARTLGRLQIAFRLTDDEIELLAADINALENRFGAFAEEIVTAVYHASESAANLGVSAGDIAAWSAVIIEAGVDAQRAGTSIRRMFDYMIKNADIMSRAMGMSMEDFRAAVNENAFEVMSTFILMAQNTEDKFGLMTEVIDIFGLKGSAGIRKLTHAAEEYHRAQAVLDKEGLNLLEFNEEYEKANNTLAASIEKLKNVMLNFLLQIGQGFAPVMKWLADAFVEHRVIIFSLIKLFIIWASTWVTLTIVTKLAAYAQVLFASTLMSTLIPTMQAGFWWTMNMGSAFRRLGVTAAIAGGIIMSIALIAMTLGGKFNWLTGIIIAITIAIAVMKAVMGDMGAAFKGLLIAGVMIAAMSAMQNDLEDITGSLDDMGMDEGLPELNNTMDALNTTLGETNDTLDKVNARDMSVSIPITINFGSEVAGMSAEEFEVYATRIINTALIDGLRDAGLFQVG